MITEWEHILFTSDATLTRLRAGKRKYHNYSYCLFL